MAEKEESLLITKSMLKYILDLTEFDLSFVRYYNLNILRNTLTGF